MLLDRSTVPQWQCTLNDASASFISRYVQYDQVPTGTRCSVPHVRFIRERYMIALHALRDNTYGAPALAEFFSSNSISNR